MATETVRQVRGVGIYHLSAAAMAVEAAGVSDYETAMRELGARYNPESVGCECPHDGEYGHLPHCGWVVTTAEAVEPEPGEDAPGDEDEDDGQVPWYADPATML